MVKVILGMIETDVKQIRIKIFKSFILYSTFLLLNFSAMLALTILGNNSAVPAFDRHPTSQVVTMDGDLFLVDCGEGTQIQMIKYKIRRSRISHIFISHLHGDHYFGLVGLINSFGLLNHLQDLHIYAPSPLQEIIEWQLKVASTTLPYKLFFHTITRKKP